MLELMKNKEFAFACIEMLIRSNKVTSKEIQIMTSAESCKELFSCSSGFPVLMEVPESCEGDDLKTFCLFGGKRRYYSEKVHINGSSFVVVNHWYGPNMTMPDNRTPFYNWVRALIEQ